MREKGGLVPALLYSLLGIIGILILISTLALTYYQKNDGLQINLAGRERMLSQRILKELLLYKNREDNAKKIENDLFVFDTTLKGLIRGESVPLDLELKKYKELPPVTDISIQNDLSEIYKIWQPYKQETALYLADRNSESLNYLIEQNVSYDASPS